MTQRRLIAICSIGPQSASSGKSSVAKVLDRLGFAIVTIAGPMKDLAEELYGWDYETMDGDSALRDQPDHEGRVPRLFFQQLGDCLRLFDPESLIRNAIENVRMFRDSLGVDVVVPDVRLPLEAERLRAEGAVFWGVSRDTAPKLRGPTSLHSTERGLGADFRPDCVLDTNGPVDELEERVRLLLQVGREAEGAEAN